VEVACCISTISPGVEQARLISFRFIGRFDPVRVFLDPCQIIFREKDLAVPVSGSAGDDAALTPSPERLPRNADLMGYLGRGEVDFGSDCFWQDLARLIVRVYAG